MEEHESVFPRVLDIDPHERIGQLEHEIEGIAPAELLRRGSKALDEGNTLLALVCLRQAAVTIDTPELLSNLAFCKAKELARFEEAAALCRTALEKDPDNTLHYLNMGRILLLQGKKTEAMEIFNEGLNHGPDSRISADLQLLGTRRKPVIPFLHRKHLLNQSLGYILDRARFRRH